MNSITDDLVIACDEILNTTETVLINSKDVEVAYRLGYILRTLLVTILIFKIVAICYYCLKYRSKQKDILPY